MNDNVKSLKASEISPSVVVYADFCPINKRVIFNRFDRSSIGSILVSSLMVDLSDVAGIENLATVDEYLNFVRLNARYIVQKPCSFYGGKRFKYINRDGIGHIQYDLNLFGG